jgi:hypothetical protein
MKAPHDEALSSQGRSNHAQRSGEDRHLTMRRWPCCTDVTLHENARMRWFTRVAAAYLRIIFKLSATAAEGIQQT